MLAALRLADKVALSLATSRCIHAAAAPSVTLRPAA